MSLNKKIIALSVLIAPLFVFGMVSAQEHDETEMSNETSTQTEQEPKTGNEGLNLQERLQKRKDALKTRLNNAQKVRLQARCKASQTHVSEIKKRVGSIKSKRDTTYTNLMQRLNGLPEKLKTHDINTTELEKQIAELQIKVDTFRTDLAKYQEAVGDLSDMDCVADADGFQASLNDARTLRAQVVSDGQAIRTYLRDPIKKTLKTIHDELATTHQEGSH